MARRLGKRISGSPGMPLPRVNTGNTGRRGISRLLARDESRGITMPEANSLGLLPVQASLTTALAGSNNDLVFTKKKNGELPAVKVAYVDPGGTTATLGVVVTKGLDDVYTITVNLGRAASAINTTATLLKAAVDGNADAAALVSVANATGNDGTGLVIAMAAAALTGGRSDVNRAGPGLAGDTSGAGVTRQPVPSTPNAGKKTIRPPRTGGLRRS